MFEEGKYFYTSTFFFFQPLKYSLIEYFFYISVSQFEKYQFHGE